MQVSRYSSFFVVNNLVPIILSTALGFFVFLLDVDEMVRFQNLRKSSIPADVLSLCLCVILQWNVVIAHCTCLPLSRQQRG